MLQEDVLIAQTFYIHRVIFDLGILLLKVILNGYNGKMNV